MMENNLRVGQIIEGTVTGIKPFGAFVKLDEKTQGLVHISQVTHGFLKDINEVLSVGDLVKVKILSIDEKTKKVSLSIKEAKEKERPVKPAKDKVQKLDDMMKNWLKESNDRQAVLNKRNSK